MIENYVEKYERINMREMIENEREEMMNVIIKEGNLRKIEENIYIKVEERREEGRIGGILIEDQRDKKIDIIYYEEEGEIE